MAWSRHAPVRPSKSQRPRPHRRRPRPPSNRPSPSADIHERTMNLSRFFIDRPIFAAVLSAFLVPAGLAAIRVLPIAQYPDIAPPVVSVRAVYPGASAQVLEQTVAAPLENQINGVENMIFMSSNSGSNGLLEIQVTFDIGSDADQAAL